MNKELKISLPIYKVAYALCFIILLSLVRVITYTNEIGIALESPIAVLTFIFCTDTYVIEIISKRSEINRLYPMKKRVNSLYKRMIIQMMFLFVISFIGYGLFWIVQQPVSEVVSDTGGKLSQLQNEVCVFGIYMGSIVVTICFWGVLSNVIACLFRNIWGGIGGCLLLYFNLYSKRGDQLLGKWNVFSYTFRDIWELGDMSWLWGKGICVCLIILCIILLPKILKKRG